VTRSGNVGRVTADGNTVFFSLFFISQLKQHGAPNVRTLFFSFYVVNENKVEPLKMSVTVQVVGPF